MSLCRRADSDIVVMTTEILRNIMYRQEGEGGALQREDRLANVGMVVLDEARPPPHPLFAPKHTLTWPSRLAMMVCEDGAGCWPPWAKVWLRCSRTDSWAVSTVGAEAPAPPSFAGVPQAPSVCSVALPEANRVGSGSQLQRHQPAAGRGLVYLFISELICSFVHFRTSELSCAAR